MPASSSDLGDCPTCGVLVRRTATPFDRTFRGVNYDLPPGAGLLVLLPCGHSGLGPNVDWTNDPPTYTWTAPSSSPTGS